MMNTEITTDHIKQVLEIFQTTSYEAGNCENETAENTITRKCEELFKLDYNLLELDNLNGTLSTRYPCRIFIPDNEKNHNSNFLNSYDNYGGNGSGPPSPNINYPSNNSQKLSSQQQYQTTQHNVIYEDLCDLSKTSEIIARAKYARCRQRFIVPVILFRGRYICRSATISVIHETYGKKCVDMVYDCLNGSNTTSSSTNNQQQQQQQQVNRNNQQKQQQEVNKNNDEHIVFMEDENDDQSYESIISSTEQSPFSYEEVIKSDIQLLNSLNVTTIVDLMMEQRKIKFYMPVSSSEKVESQYENFNIVSLPYPGCEFFKKFRDNNYMAKNLLFNWNQTYIDAKLTIPKNSTINDLSDIDWFEYKNWDLVLITQNYLKAILKYIQDENKGLLVHCISGWDRTPLFISLIRLSLWADGLIHQSLSPLQITYLTLAYDWYLFAHQLPDRISRGEDILFFTFYFLKYITDDEYIVVEHRKRTKTTSSSGSSGGQLVFKHDYFDEDSKDDSIMEENICDQDSNDGFINIEIANANENITTNITKNRSPNSKLNKTSPISVPGVSCRQRHDSTSSNNSNNSSWQVINDAGSIDSVKSNMMRYILNDQHPNCSSSCSKPITSIRKQRLNAVRSIFVQSYGKHVGLKFQEGSSLNISNILDAITDQLF